MNSVVIITGGTINKVAPHFAVSSPAYGKIGQDIAEAFNKYRMKDYTLIKTKMADPKFTHPSLHQAGLTAIETNEDLEIYLKYLNTQDQIKVVVMSSAVADFYILDEKGNKIEGRLSSSKSHIVELIPSKKLLQVLDNKFVVSFKTLYNESHNEIKASKNTDFSDLIFVNDIGERKNGLISNGQLKWLNSREEAVHSLIMSIMSHLGLSNAKCIKCGIQEGISMGDFFNSNCDCGSRKRSIMSYKSILKDKYEITSNPTI